MTTASSQDPRDQTQRWACPTCGESLGPEFDACWHCGTSREGAADPDFDPAVVKIAELTSCRYCDYPLKALTVNRCPECGRAFDPEIVDTPREPPPYGGRRPLTADLRRAMWAMLCFTVAMPLTISGFAYADEMGGFWPAIFGGAMVINITGLGVTPFAIAAAWLTRR